MSWNDENIELLKKLWSEGFSCSQIAGRLKGMSRNAVIGKVHRLGLSGRATTSRMKSHHPRKARTPKPAKPRQPTHFGKRPASARLYDMGESYEPYVSPGGDLEIPVKERKKLTDLTESSCRWPIGDPQHADFHFCNRDHAVGLPYCEFHARRAFQPPQPRRRDVREPGVVSPAYLPRTVKEDA